MDSESERLRQGFLQWQCQLRNLAMRDEGAMPDPGTKAALILSGGTEPITEIAAVLNRQPEHSRTSEIRQIANETKDPVLRPRAVMEFFSEGYYQRFEEFSDILTATFLADSKLAARLAADKRCTLQFEQSDQIYELPCTITRLTNDDPLRDATFWHNRLFNPGLAMDCVVLGFQPDWSTASTS